MRALESPCIKTCDLDPVGGLCRGCGRTLAEIAQWTQLSPAQRGVVMAQLPGRLAHMQERTAGATRPL
jgi:predicted Fe-S protein YdhL (DUF1289 family)